MFKQRPRGTWIPLQMNSIEDIHLLVGMLLLIVWGFSLLVRFGVKVVRGKQGLDKLLTWQTTASFHLLIAAFCMPSPHFYFYKFTGILLKIAFKCLEKRNRHLHPYLPTEANTTLHQCGIKVCVFLYVFVYSPLINRCTNLSEFVVRVTWCISYFEFPTVLIILYPLGNSLSISITLFS